MDFPSQGLGLIADEGGGEGHQQIQSDPDRPKTVPRGTPAAPPDINNKPQRGGGVGGGVQVGA